MSSVEPRLPFDLLEHLLSSLSQERASAHNSNLSLAACSLVCRSWRGPCQRKLFYKAQVKLDPDRYEELERFLDASPHLWPIICNLRIAFALQPPGLLACAIRVLDILPNVRTLSLYGTHTKDESGMGAVYGVWESSQEIDIESPPFEIAIGKVLANPSFTHLTVENFAMFLGRRDWEFHRLLNQTQTLKSLEMIDNELIWSNALPPPLSPVSKVPLEKLNLTSRMTRWMSFRGHEDEWPKWLGLFNFDKLTDLVIPHGQKRLCELVGSIPSLVQLTVVLHELDWSQRSIDLSKNTSLTSISFIICTNGGATPLLSWIGPTISTLPLGNSVKTLAFTMFASQSSNNLDLFIRTIDTQPFSDLWENIGFATTKSASLRKIKFSAFWEKSESSLNVDWGGIASRAKHCLLSTHGQKSGVEFDTEIGAVRGFNQLHYLEDI